jgi:hypothetical protein
MIGMPNVFAPNESEMHNFMALLSKMAATLVDMRDIIKSQAREKPEKTEENAEFLSLLRTRKEFCDAFHISPTTLDRKVREKKIEKVLVLGPKNPRYRLMPGQSQLDSE